MQRWSYISSEIISTLLPWHRSTPSVFTSCAAQRKPLKRIVGPLTDGWNQQHTSSTSISHYSYTEWSQNLQQEICKYSRRAVKALIQLTQRAKWLSLRASAIPPTLIFAFYFWTWSSFFLSFQKENVYVSIVFFKKENVHRRGERTDMKAIIGGETEAKSAVWRLKCVFEDSDYTWCGADITDGIICWFTLMMRLTVHSMFSMHFTWPPTLPFTSKKPKWSKWSVATLTHY